MNRNNDRQTCENTKLQNNMFKDLDDVVNGAKIYKMLHNVNRQYVCKLIRTGRIPGKKKAKGILGSPKIYVIKYILENEENA